KLARTFSSPDPGMSTDDLVSQLLQSQGSSIVISGSNDTGIQLIVNAINVMLGNYGNTIDLGTPLLSRKGRDAETYALIERIRNNQVGGVIFYDVNPVYDFPLGEELEQLITQCELVVSLATHKNETAEASQYVCPDNHFLESWNDAEIKPGMLTLSQPAIRQLFPTRQAQESLLIWSGNPIPFQQYLKTNWRENMFANTGEGFENFWIKCLQDGVYNKNVNRKSQPAFQSTGLEEAFADFPGNSNKFELSFYYKVGPGSGKHANNPWLQELPDPVTRSAWDNYLCVSPGDASANDWKTGDLVSVDNKITIPVFVQPGQAKGTLSVALGYGRKAAGKAGEGVGQNFASFVRAEKGNRQNITSIESVTKTGGTYSLALTQMHHSMEGRAIIRSAPMREFLKDPAAGNEMHSEITKTNTSIYPKHVYKGHHWGMAIDLSKCTGCSACVVACTVENNVPVVGRKEVLRSHEMHWIRIDRYYEGEAENPEVYRQPVLCQHCDNAPCENVCPVAATTHSDEG
ncbi:MAG: 4Fe-4S dicluster domain-containing protein, partial [Spirochaetaceae bacterium]